jgi:hypothetical protein
VKKSRLATPAGIDHDFNFISNLERSRGDAEKVLEDRGLAPATRALLPIDSESARRRIAMTQVIVERAPIGMSRQKRNSTRWTKGVGLSCLA